MRLRFQLRSLRMTQKIIDIGIQGNDGTGDSIRESFRKVNENFTEMYAIFGEGGTINFTNLGDTPASYLGSQIIMASVLGDKLTARTLVEGNGIAIDADSSNSTVTISATTQGLNSDPAQTGLAGHLNANTFAIGSLSDPTAAAASQFESYFPTSLLTLPPGRTTQDQLAMTKGYADRNYVASFEGTIVSALKSRAQPAVPELTNPDYDPTLTSNYLSTEVMQRKDVVYRGGDTMTGRLNLSDHPGAAAGAGTPNGSDDLQAASKYYVDNKTFTSNVNLYVSTASGDDVQAKSPPGKEGRFWQYAYKTIGAAALQAENLIELASIEPGPYKQRIAYTVGPDQTQTTVESVVLSGGNSGLPGYQDAADLLTLNKTFIQAETIAYLNKKYVNAIVIDETLYTEIITKVIDGVCYDLVVDSDYNSITVASNLFEARYLVVLTEQQTQVLDAVDRVRNTILDYNYNSTATENYIGMVLDALGYDLVFQGSFQSLQTGLAFDQYSTELSTDEITAVISNLGATLLTYSAVTVSPNAISSITANIAAINATIINNSITVSADTFPDQTSTSDGLTSAKQLLLANIPFVQAEIVAYLQSNYPDVVYNKTTLQRDIKYIAWALVYDLMYGGDQQSSYVGSQVQFQTYQLTAILDAVGYINTLAQAIIVNDPSALIYQTSFRQYTNETLVNGNEASAGITANVATIQYIITNVGPAHTVTYPDITGTASVLRTARTSFTSSGAKTTLKSAAIDFIDTNPDFSILNNPAVNAVVNARFDDIENIIVLGASTRTSPDYTYPSGLISGYRHAQAAIDANISFIVEDSYAFGIATNPSFVPYDGVVAFKRRLSYFLEALMYDITYGGNSATVSAAQAYWIDSSSILPTNEKTITGSILNHLETVTTFVVANTSVTNPSIGNFIATTGASGNGVHATITFADQGSAPYTVGQVITVTGITPAGYNGYWTVTNCTATSVSWASTVTGSQTVAGKITKQVQSVAWTGGSSAPVGILLNAVIDIIANNTATAKTYPVLTSYDSDLTSARTIIQSNRSMITSDIIDYLKATYKGGFNYNEATCYRDVGYIIDGMSIDILTGGNYQTVTAGKSYYKSASARLAITTQLTETIDGITFAKNLALQVLNKTDATRYQTLVVQNFGMGLSPAAGAITLLGNNMNTIVSIIVNGIGAAPAASFGTGIYTVTFSNGGNGYVDQGSPGSVHIIPGKILIGGTSEAAGVIVKYLPGSGPSVDSIQVRLTKPGFFVAAENLDFGETVKDLNITIFVESGIYLEDYPIRLSANCSIKGDEFRRTIIRPIDRVSQSPWRKIFFYRDSIIDAMEVGVIDTGTDYRTSSSLILGGTTGKIIATLGSGQAPNSWIGKIIQDNTAVTPGKAVIDSISGNTLNCSVIYPFAAKVTYASGNWHLYGTKDYGRHYLTDPLDINSVAKNNKDVDVLLCNDATRISNLTFQGHGGFAMVLDPEGQIKTKSPYGQVATSFSQSINAKAFRGGQFVDGFAGRLFGTITDIEDSGITVTVTGSVNSGLDIRPPQVPCVYYVQGNRYQVNDVVSYDPVTYTVVLTLDVSTPFDPADDYNSATFATEVDVLTDELTYDLLFGSNYQSVKAGLNYSQPKNAKIGIRQLYLLSGINKLRDEANSIISNATSQGVIAARTSVITDIISQGLASVPTLTFPDPVGAITTVVNAKNILVANREFIRSEIVAWIAANFSTKTIFQYNAVKTSRDIGYILDALTYDILYGGNSSTLDVAGFYWDGSTNQIIGQEEYYAAALSQMMNVIEQVITNVSVSVSLGNLLTQNTSLSAASALEVATVKELLSISIDYILDGNINNSVIGTTTSGSATITSVNYNGALVAGRTVTGVGITVSPATTVVSYDPATKILVINQPATVSTAHTKLTISGTAPTRIVPTIPTDSSYAQVKADRTTIVNAKASIKTNITTYLNSGGGLGINIEMGGNRSMLANDFAMINDLGYAIFCTNGGVSEQVSTFSYYCHTHYWANNGGQIRSVAGSNAHGDYALRATGYDVTELPDSVTLANDMVQTARVYKQSSVSSQMTPTATTQALSIWILGYEYSPPNNAELEIDHSLSSGVITRYLISTVEHTTITVGGQNVLKVNLSTAGTNSTVTTGLAYELYDGQLLVIRVNQNIKFNNIDNVKPTRPSTAVQYGENLADIYRIVAYSLVDSTGEALASNIAILQSDAGFNYYKFNSDPTYISAVDPQNALQTQGSKVGDNKIAVLQISQQAIIDQVNKGIYLTGWGGRVHRIISYTVPTFIATGQFSIYTTPSGVPTLTVTSVAGSIDIGDVLTGTGFTAGQYVTDVQLSGSGSITAVVTLNAVPSPTPSGTITFGVAANGYLTIDPNPVSNNSADGTVLTAMTYKSHAAGPSGSGYTGVKFEIPFATALPAIDSFLTVANNSNTSYNGTLQVRSITNKTQVSVASTTGLSVGMLVTSVAVGAYIPDSCIIQSIDDATHFTVSPAAWIPTGSSVSSTLVAYLSGLTITDGGTSYTAEVLALQGVPLVTLSGGGATSQGLAVAVCSGGAITQINIVSPGYGYTSAPTVTLSYGNAVLTPVLSQSPTVTTAVTAGTNTVDLTLAYPTSPVVTGTATATTHGVAVTTLSSIVGTTLAIGSVSSGTVAVGMMLTGGTIPAGTYIVSNISGTGASSTWTINKSVTQGVTTITGTNDLITVNSVTDLDIGMPIVLSSATSLSGIAEGSYYVTEIIGSTQIAVSETYNGANVSVTNSSGTGVWTASGFQLDSLITITSYASVSGSGPYDVEFTIPTSSITNGAYYRITGNSNSLYNGFYQCVSSTNASATSIVLQYTYDPGIYGTGTTTLNKELTSATSTQIGISKPFSALGAATLRLGYAATTPGQITQRISTCRVTGHDLLDIGTGSYNTTNWPTVIYGNPAKDKQQSQEILEEGVGRVFYVTTDQNGVFRVGRFFTVDQGTGSVTFSASIALSNLDGLGFKRGVVVSEFSTDPSMTNNASDTVPVQSAIRSYIDKRLGLDHGGSPVALNSLIGPAYMALNGSLAMKGNLNMGNYSITNMGTAISATDATNKAYVDSAVVSYNALFKLTDATITSAATSNLLVYDGVAGKWKNASVTGDVVISLNTGTGVLSATVQAGAIDNSKVSTTAAIVQSKLSLATAGTSASSPTGTTAQIQAANGLASFNSTTFTVTNGWVEVKTAVSASTGITYGKIQYMSAGTLLGNRTVGAASPTEVTPAQVVSDAGGLTNSLFASSGVVTITYDGSSVAGNTYPVVGITSSRAANNIVKTGSSGEVDVGFLKVGGYKAVSLTGAGATLTSTFTTPGTFDYMTALGTTSSNTVISTYGTLDTSNGTLKANLLTTDKVGAGSGAGSGSASISGWWAIQASSQIDFSLGTLKSLSLDAGTETTDATIRGRWTLTGASRMQATYADLAEYYEGDTEYEPGTVLVFGGDKEVTTTTQINDTRSAGVVSTDPAYVMNHEQTGIRVCLALAGRVPCKVIGRVKKGDMLTTSATPGYAVKALNPTLGAVLGKALEDKDYGEAGVIQVAVGRV
jgi:hypothetical protein